MSTLFLTLPASSPRNNSGTINLCSNTVCSHLAKCYIQSLAPSNFLSLFKTWCRNFLLNAEETYICGAERTNHTIPIQRIYCYLLDKKKLKEPFACVLRCVFSNATCIRTLRSWDGPYDFNIIFWMFLYVNIAPQDNCQIYSFLFSFSTCRKIYFFCKQAKIWSFTYTLKWCTTFYHLTAQLDQSLEQSPIFGPDHVSRGYCTIATLAQILTSIPVLTHLCQSGPCYILQWVAVTQPSSR